MKNRLFAPIDNAPLVLFRIFLGFLLACETFGAILTGWVKANFIVPKFTFSHIGMSWLQPLPGNGMYYYFIIMGVAGLAVMAGFRYRFFMGLFTIMWAGVYFMQKTSYNNHYYLLMLVCLMMFFLPAHRYASVDVALKPSLKKLSMPTWCSWVMIAMISIVYFYATLAKFYPGWLNGTFINHLMNRSVTINSLLPVMTSHGFALFIAYTGIAFDLLFVPLMLNQRTRIWAFAASIIFHIFNSITLSIGIFPFFALSFAVFFFPPEKIRSMFFRKKPQVYQKGITYEARPALYFFFVPFLLIMLLLPLRHYLIKGDVLWTEEGHRLSWRMMLRNRDGNTDFKIVDKKTGGMLFYDLYANLTPKQKNNMDARPDMIWQMAQHIKAHFAARGKDVAVYAIASVSVNGDPAKTFIDPTVDLTRAPWDYFWHNDWIMLYDSKDNPVK